MPFCCHYGVAPARGTEDVAYGNAIYALAKMRATWRRDMRYAASACPTPTGCHALFSDADAATPAAHAAKINVYVCRCRTYGKAGFQQARAYAADTIATRHAIATPSFHFLSSFLSLFTIFSPSDFITLHAFFTFIADDLMPLSPLRQTRCYAADFSLLLHAPFSILPCHCFHFAAMIFH